jgi:hypothetical protein
LINNELALIVRNFGLTFYEAANISYPETYKEQKVYALRGSSLLPFVSGKNDKKIQRYVLFLL